MRNGIIVLYMVYCCFMGLMLWNDDNKSDARTYLVGTFIMSAILIKKEN